jgi:hypothetical protein
MAAFDFYRFKQDEKHIIFNQLAAKLKIHPASIEKDWWVVRTLELILTMDVSEFIVFKGGTSLSKAWNIIERFSEDVDLALDRSFLGYEECKTVKQVKKLRSSTRNYIYKDFIPGLQNAFIKAGYSDVEVKLNEEEGKNLEPVQISILYKSCTANSAYTNPYVKIEIGSRSLREPSTNKEFSSLVGEHFPDRPFADRQIIVSCVNPERTLLEKLFLLHEEFSKPEDKIKVDRLSRHLYDVEMLTRKGFLEIAIKEKELYNEIINHRQIYTKISEIDYNFHQPKTLNPLPPKAIMNSWKKDYQKMQEEMIHGDSLSFNELIERIAEIKNRINALEW